MLTYVCSLPACATDASVGSRFASELRDRFVDLLATTELTDIGGSPACPIDLSQSSVVELAVVQNETTGNYAVIYARECGTNISSCDATFDVSGRLRSASCTAYSKRASLLTLLSTPVAILEPATGEIVVRELASLVYESVGAVPPSFGFNSNDRPVLQQTGSAPDPDLVSPNGSEGSPQPIMMLNNTEQCRRCMASTARTIRDLTELVDLGYSTATGVLGGCVTVAGVGGGISALYATISPVGAAAFCLAGAAGGGVVGAATVLNMAINDASASSIQQSCQRERRCLKRPACTVNWSWAQNVCYLWSEGAYTYSYLEQPTEPYGLLQQSGCRCDRGTQCHYDPVDNWVKCMSAGLQVRRGVQIEGLFNADRGERKAQT